MTPKQMKRVEDIAEKKAREFCKETGMHYMPNIMYIAHNAILAAMADPMLNPTCSDAREQEMGCYRAVAAENELAAAKAAANAPKVPSAKTAQVQQAKYGKQVQGSKPAKRSAGRGR